jgi:hypothetical protein
MFWLWYNVLGDELLLNRPEMINRWEALTDLSKLWCNRVSHIIQTVFFVIAERPFTTPSHARGYPLWLYSQHGRFESTIVWPSSTVCNQRRRSRPIAGCGRRQDDGSFGPATIMIWHGACCVVILGCGICRLVNWTLCSIKTQNFPFLPKYISTLFFNNQNT